MPNDDTADYYNDLENTLSHAHGLLRGAVDQPASPLRTPVFASIKRDAQGTLSASSRMVVMREFNSEDRHFSFYTDSRSSKVQEIENHPAVSAVFYDPENRIQLRLSGHCSIHCNDNETAKTWRTLPSHNKALYGTNPGPGTHLAAGDDYETGSIDASQHSEFHFCILKVFYHQLEWLYLASQGHRRAQYDWQTNGTLTSQWVAP
ncbi:pyridoxamine 5'-phosphate oxidase family protein [Pararhizobium sp. IMCC21322]|uniref:pyridoxamine 5'-phosphate oxidase family protein n=1 Tax=Pararhizobium sp. IMCC21322 TaxID=3067903 RepID=UPI0027408FA9|nr:pyridoxamine 5'-phosphate oxidase family protein [Pararhizobium sp. IMCC21322]